MPSNGMKKWPAGLRFLLSVTKTEAIGACLAVWPAAPQLWHIWAESRLAERNLLPIAQGLVCAKVLLQSRDILEGMVNGIVKEK